MPAKKGCVPWQKGKPSIRRGKTHEEFFGIEKANEIKQKISLGNSGKIHSEEWKRKESESKKGSIPWNKGKPFLAKELNPWFGKSPSDRTRTMMSLSKKGKKWEEIWGIEGAQKRKEARLHLVLPRKDSSIERKIQLQLDNAQIQYTKHKSITGQPDLFIEPNNSSYKGVAIFIDGCATHPCPIHHSRITKAFDDDSRRAHDEMITKKLFDDGYYVVRVWKHDIKQKDFDIIPILEDVMPLHHVRKEILPEEQEEEKELAYG